MLIVGIGQARSGEILIAGDETIGDGPFHVVARALELLDGEVGTVLE